MHFILQMLVQVRGDIYTARFRLSSVDCKRRYQHHTAQENERSNNQNQSQLWPETDMLMPCIPYKRTICPHFIFAHFTLFVSILKLGKFQCLIILSFFYHNIVGVNSRPGKTISRSKKHQGAKITLHPVYTNGKTWKLKPINSKTLQEHMRQIEQQSHGHTTHINSCNLSKDF